MGIINLYIQTLLDDCDTFINGDLWSRNMI
jgi:hypothetical protein